MKHRRPPSPLALQIIELRRQKLPLEVISERVNRCMSVVHRYLQRWAPPEVLAIDSRSDYPGHPHTEKREIVVRMRKEGALLRETAAVLGNKPTSVAKMERRLGLPPRTR